MIARWEGLAQARPDLSVTFGSILNADAEVFVALWASTLGAIAFDHGRWFWRSFWQGTTRWAEGPECNLGDRFDQKLPLGNKRTKEPAEEVFD